jgi:tetratricopeptide (TPR) repeat protein
MISQGIRHDRTLRETVSHETVSAALRGESVPGWGKVQSIIHELAKNSVDQHDLRLLDRRFHTLWLAARAAPKLSPTQREPIGADTASAQPSETSVAPPVVTGQVVDRPDPPAGPAPAVPVAPAVPAVPRRRVRDAVSEAVRHEVVRQVTADRVNPSHGKIIGELPDRNHSFVGRELLLDTMQNRMLDNPGYPLVLYGLDGSGKTQLAAEYLYQFSDYSVIWWVPADPPERARASLLSLAQRLGTPIYASGDDTIAALLSRLGSMNGSGYIMVFDGAVDPVIRQLMPSAGGHVIVTSRDPGWATDGSSVALRVPEFDYAEAIQFLRKRDGELDGAEAEDVLRVVGRLPLALEQVAAVRAATGRPWAELRARLSEPESGVFSVALPTHYPHTVAGSLRLALNHMSAENPVAAHVFELFAWFGSGPVSTALLRCATEVDVGEPLAVVLDQPVELAKAIATISRYGLANLHGHGQAIEAQPLMRHALRDILPAHRLERSRRDVQAILATADPGWPDDLPTLETHGEISAHVVAADLVSSRDGAAQKTVLNQIRYRLVTGDLSGACELGETAVAAWRDDGFLGAGHEHVLLATREWANALRAAGRYAQARELTTQAMERLRADPRYADDHPHALAMASSHAADLRIAGRYSEALRLDRQTYLHYAAKHGDQDGRAGISQQNMAASLRHVGNFEDAAILDRGEFNRHRDARGNGHIATRLAVNALAQDLYGLGRYRDALELQEPYFATGHDLNPTHPGVLLAARTVALSRRGLGDVAGAVEMLRSHYHSCVDSLPADHEYALAAAMSYANTLREQGRVERAHTLAEEAVEAYRETFGWHNPLSLLASVSLAAILRARGDHDGALLANVTARDGLRQVLGDHHPYTIAAIAGLATDHAIAGRQDEALRLSEQARDLVKEVRGPSHPDTLVVTANYGLDLRAFGATDEAEAIIAVTLASLRRTLGATNPTVNLIAARVRVDLVVEPPST